MSHAPVAEVQAYAVHVKVRDYVTCVMELEYMTQVIILLSGGFQVIAPFAREMENASSVKERNNVPFVMEKV